MNEKNGYNPGWKNEFFQKWKELITQSAVTSERLGAAFQNFVDVLRSYSRAK